MSFLGRVSQGSGGGGGTAYCCCRFAKSSQWTEWGVCKISFGAFFEFKIQEEGEVSLVFLLSFFYAKCLLLQLQCKLFCLLILVCLLGGEFLKL